MDQDTMQDTLLSLQRLSDRLNETLLVAMRPPMIVHYSSSKKEEVMTNGKMLLGSRMIDEALPMPPNFFIDPNADWDEYTCPRKLHTYKLPQGGGFRYVIGTAIGTVAETGDLCPVCFTEWLDGSFPTKITGKVKPPGFDNEGPF